MVHHANISPMAQSRITAVADVNLLMRRGRIRLSSLIERNIKPAIQTTALP